MLHVILRYGAAALFAAMLTAAYLQTSRQRADQICFSTAA